jgi:hypothetical protein
MGLLERILGSKAELGAEALPAGPAGRDSSAVREYERMLRSAPRETIERAHVEAFEKLTPEQLDILFDRFSSVASADGEKPSDARPVSLASAASRAEAREPGTITRVLAHDAREHGSTTRWGKSILGVVAAYAIATAVWISWESDSASLTPTDTDPSGGWFNEGAWFLDF